MSAILWDRLFYPAQEANHGEQVDVSEAEVIARHPTVVSEVGVQLGQHVAYLQQAPLDQLEPGRELRVCLDEGSKVIFTHPRIFLQKITKEIYRVVHK